ncbi:MAG: hypothetical protein ABI222_05230 [Opitutaceae bacterium]
MTRLGAQELTMLYGGMQTEGKSSYAYQVDYRQNFIRYAAASVAYINEGHIVGHHRDGTAFELWGRLPLFNDRFAVSVGAGTFYFYDTQFKPGGGTANIHGTALIYSASATAYLGGRWFVRANVNRISPQTQLQTTTSTLGLGFWFGQGMKPTKGRLGDAPDEYKYVTDPQLTFFGGQTVVNTFLSPSAQAYAAEYRRGIIPHLDWTVSGIYEGDPEIVRRRGVAAQVWAVNTFFDDHASVGVGVGPYVYIDHKHPAPSDQRNPAAVAPLVSFTLATALSEHWVARLMFNRVTSSYDRDADMFFIGLGYRWSRKSG